MAHPGGLFSFSRGREVPAGNDGNTYLRESHFSASGKTRCCALPGSALVPVFAGFHMVVSVWTSWWV